MKSTHVENTRRLFLKGVSALAIGAAVVFGGQSGLQAADKELTLFEWSGYEDPEFHKAYVEKYKDSPQYAYFGDEEEAFQKLRAGFKADIAHPCTQSLPKWRAAGLIKPIDKSRITTWNDLMPQMRDMDGYQADGQVWAIPVDWGNTSMVYRTDKVDADDLQSVQVLAGDKYKGKISLPDNVDDVYALGALAIGMKDWTKMTDEQFKQASDFLRAVHKNVRFYWTDGTQLSQAMANGEVTMSWAWNETPTTMQAEGHPIKA
ncbi:MAG: extracellular solute-binding protein, partial [Aestuariivirgaceae bacterium]